MCLGWVFFRFSQASSHSLVTGSLSVFVNECIVLWVGSGMRIGPLPYLAGCKSRSVEANKKTFVIFVRYTDNVYFLIKQCNLPRVSYQYLSTKEINPVVQCYH